MRVDRNLAFYGKINKNYTVLFGNNFKSNTSF